MSDLPPSTGIEGHIQQGWNWLITIVLIGLAYIGPRIIGPLIDKLVNKEESYKKSFVVDSMSSTTTKTISEETAVVKLLLNEISKNNELLAQLVEIHREQLRIFEEQEDKDQIKRLVDEAIQDRLKQSEKDT